MRIKEAVILIFLAILIFLSACRNDEIFKNYKIKEFKFQGRDAKIVFPNKQHKNNLWIWRARFWGHEPQLDKALLAEGFHLVYVDVADLFGNTEAIEIWNQFYTFCTEKYQLNPKVVLEGMSRGGLIIYNWAGKNTDKIYCIYADAPVCDIKSWPGGLFKGKGSPESWKTCLAAYGLDSLSVKDLEDTPINNCVPIAKAGIPVLHVYGAADLVVPYEENTALLAEKFKSAGGSIQLIGKEGVGHHPHSLKDPTPIVDFIMDSIDSDTK